MAFKCPDGHDSTTSDFCSDCGLQMPVPAPGAAASDILSSPEPPPRESCPKCKTDRDDPKSPFCGVCGYNFVTRQSGDVLPQPRTVAGPAAKKETPAPAQKALRAAHIEIEITFDESNAEAPKGQPPRKFSLYEEESLIGRRSSTVAQTVGLEGDDGVSRRHLLIIRQPSGSYVARLFDNTNGGTLNGAQMSAGVEVPLEEGYKIALGAFTIIKMTAIR